MLFLGHFKEKGGVSGCWVIGESSATQGWENDISRYSPSAVMLRN